MVILASIIRTLSPSDSSASSFATVRIHPGNWELVPLPEVVRTKYADLLRDYQERHKNTVKRNGAATRSITRLTWG